MHDKSKDLTLFHQSQSTEWHRTSTAPLLLCQQNSNHNLTHTITIAFWSPVTFWTHLWRTALLFCATPKRSILADKRFHSDNGKWEIPTKPWSYRSLGSVVKEIHPDPAWATKICEADVHQHWQGWLQHHNFSPSPQCCWELQSPFPGLPCSHSTEPCGRRHILIEYLWFVTFYCGSQFWFQ